jgi:energy-converting hydrogenase A subunit B
MPGVVLNIIIAVLLCWILFITIDIIFRLPEKGGVSGANAIGTTIAADKGSLHGGFMMGNIVCSPDASAGTLLAACGVFVAGIPGGLIAAVLVYIGNRICHDPGYAGTTGALCATFMVAGFGFIGIPADAFIAGMVIAILTIQGISHPYASHLLTRLWRIRA